MAILSRLRRAKPAPAPPDALRAAAEAGHVEAQMLYAQALLDGAAGQPRDPARGFSWFCIAAGAGHAPGLNMRGRCLEQGWGTTRDLAAAAASYRAAAALGDPWGRYNLANMQLRGRGVPRDRLAAYALFEAAARDGHAKSMNLVARFHDEGWDRPRDPAIALQWYRRSAEAGDYRGRHNLAVWHAERGQWQEAVGLWQAALPEATEDILTAMAQVTAIACANAPTPELKRLAGEIAARLRPQPAADSRAR
ncbi:hypothetical protein FHR90_000850 [Endobacter medicaginis]|uniref:Sel1 repeat family protein n=2 Tax=Endobacter medicaginis TaxID=1181271 RepID=A0A839V068_9PROT|nr:tetratricopeptide repeat protein [Endobacter medicaginis]MBB3173032.1 hypothetical protein [Endobacter medicaginis]MCX5474543.1 tetratricopeptide repeat protein [Endobacter medicaginis]